MASSKKNDMLPYGGDFSRNIGINLYKLYEKVKTGEMFKLNY